MNWTVSRLVRAARQIGAAARSELRTSAQRGSVRAGTVLYESFAGNGALCNPEAIFRTLLASPGFAGLHHTWVLNSQSWAAGPLSLRTEFANDPRVSFVLYRSLAYFQALATSQYLINNATFPAEFSKRTGQIYVNTWHGTPLKHMGYDMPNGAMDSANTLRNFVSADFLLSQNPFMTQQMYETAYKLRGIFHGQIIEEGYPRVDHQFFSEKTEQAARNVLESAGFAVGGRTVVLYAPTWRGSSFNRPDDDALTLIESTRELQGLLGEQYLVLLKTHQAVHKFAAASKNFTDLLVPNDIPTNTILGLTGILVTDYSSIFFDFLATSRPIVFFTPDASSYTESRGTYFPPESLPGPVCRTLAEVSRAILTGAASAETRIGFSAPEYAERASSWREQFTGSDDGGSAARVIDIVFHGTPAGARVHQVATDERKSIMLAIGGMRSNGITSSVLNLLNAIDHDRYDVSVILSRPFGPQQLSNQARIHPQVRQFHRVGGMNGSKIQQARRRSIEFTPLLQRRKESAGQRRIWQEEWTRCFGRSKFDSVTDFSGYTAFWASLVLHSPGGIRSIWLHNDMSAETGRVIRNRRRMSRSLPAVFALYPFFDSLVSVSPSLSDVNRRELTRKYRLSAENFRSARNLVDETHVNDGLKVSLEEISTYGSDTDRSKITETTPDWLEQLDTDNGLVWFVNVGRFSTEKNQARLIRAFASIHAEFVHTRLLIVGYGPLRDELVGLVNKLNLGSAVFIVGPYPNPFPLLAAADCFVLSSDYEGQPMVLLEAAIAGLPMISVDFGSVRDALPGSFLHVVEQSDDGLASGMRAFLAGEISPSSLDVDLYNDSAVAEFYEATSGFASVRSHR